MRVVSYIRVVCICVSELCSCGLCLILRSAHTCVGDVLVRVVSYVRVVHVPVSELCSCELCLMSV